MGQTMRAALLRQINEPFSIEQVELLELDPHRVLIKTHASPFCSTDVVNWSGGLYKIPPTILGHASIGEIVEVGAKVERLRPGQRVVVPGTPECGTCYYCSIGEPWQCSELFDLGGIYPDIARTHEGLLVNCAGCVGGYAEYMSISENQAFPVESDLDSETLSMLGCGITTGVGNVFNVAKVKPGETVVVVGAGHIGLWSVQAAVLAQAGTVISVEPIERRRRIAGELGAEHLIDPGAVDAVAAVKELTAGRGADVVIEAAGATDAQRLALLLSRRAGRVVYTGLQRGGAEVTVPQVEMALQSRQLLSSQSGNVHQRSDIPRYITMLEKGRLRADKIVTNRYDLSELDTARDRSGSKEDITGLIVFEH